MVIATKRNGNLIFHHFYTKNLRSREMILTDAKVMKAIHDNLPTNSRLTIEGLVSIPSATVLGKASLNQSLKRIREMYRLDLVERGFFFRVRT